MRFASDPAIATKIARMKQRVRWQHPLVAKHNIDQTRLTIQTPLTVTQESESLSQSSGQNGSQNKSQNEGQNGFSFLVIGDSGTSRHFRDQPQRHVAERLIEHAPECEFILHTGDVVYLTGSSEQYPDNFIKPYREFIVGGETPDKIRFDKMTFKLPFLPVLGNHDYYDWSAVGGMLTMAFTPLRRLLRKRINLDIGWHGSFQGEGFAKAFMDCLDFVGPGQIDDYLQQHYSSQTDTGRCLNYVPGEFTRLPNRYYTFRRDGIDFFALDSNTFNAPQPLPENAAGQLQREKIEAYQAELDERMRSLLQESETLDVSDHEQAERADYIYAKVEQLEEELGDIEKQLNASQADYMVDTEQLDWLRDRLTASWHDKQAKGRVLYFHHPPYVTEKTKWFQAQTLAVRFHLRQVLDQVKAKVGEAAAGRPLVDLVLNGHAHCFEYLKTEAMGYGDSNISWVVCGGSGFSLRRQRKEGAVLEEFGQPVAKCHLFIGRSGVGSKKRRPYSALRVDVKYTDSTDIPQFELRPLIVERYQGKWHTYDLGPINLQVEAPAEPLLLPEPTAKQPDELSSVS